MISSVRPAVSAPPPSGYTSAVSKKSTPAVERAVEDGERGRLVALEAEGHRAQAQSGNPDSGSSQRSSVHRVSLARIRACRSVPDWEEVERELLQDCRIFTVSRTTARSPHTGQPHPFYRIDSADWVNIVALTPADELS